MNHFIQQAIHYMQLMHYAKALNVCDDILTSGYNHPQVHLIKAIALGKTGQLENSRDVFETLVYSFPQNSEIFYNYALILQDNNKDKEALENYNKCLQYNPEHSSALCNTGVIKLNQNKSRQACDYFKRALDIQPKNIEYLKNYAHSLFQLNDFKAAQDILLEFTNPKQFSVDDMTILLECLYKTREHNKALSYCNKALKLYPTNPNILNIACLLELDNKKYKRAFSLSSKAIGLKPKKLEFQITHLTAWSYVEPNSHEIYLQLKTIVNLHKDTKKVYIFASTLCEAQGKLKKAKTFLKKGLKLNPQCPKLWLLKSKTQKQLKQHKRALNSLNKAFSYCQDAKLKSQIFYEKSHILDLRKKYSKAWKYIKKANKVNKTNVLNNDIESQFVTQSNTLCTQIQKIDTKRMDTEIEHPRVIFIIGFPRSGTTLLEKILNTLPQTKILEETNAINEIYSQLYQNNPNTYFQSLSELSIKQIIELQNNYFDSLSDYFDWNKKDIVIDKMPMNANHLALIKKIFPQAKILFAVRHPIDVCLSCLMQDMLQVFTFSEAVRVYQSYMRVYKLYKTKLSLNIYEIKYEELVTDFENEVKKVLTFLNLDWNEKITTFYQSKALVNTPSYQQVNQPIYKQAIYRYKNYLSGFIDEVKPLHKWIKHYNYEI